MQEDEFYFRDMLLKVMSLLKFQWLQWTFIILSTEENTLKISFSLMFQSSILKGTRNAVWYVSAFYKNTWKRNIKMIKWYL